MTIKLTFFYNQYKQGFSETYYQNVTNPALAINTMSPQLLTSMTSFRSNATLLYAIRGQQIESPFRSYTKLIRGAYQGGSVSGGDEGPDVVGTTAVLQLVSEEATKRRLFLRGLPDQYVIRDAFGNDVFIGTFKTAVQKMVAQFIGNGFAIRKQTRPPIGGLAYARVPLLSSDPANARFTRVIYDVTAGFTPIVGGKVVFKGMPSGSLPNFPRVATVVTNVVVGAVGTLTVLYGLPGGLTVNPTKMVVSNLVFAYEVITEFTFERFSAHKTGSPFGRLAGRKRAVLSVSR